MTCREKLKSEYPEDVDPDCIGGCCGCPSDHEYLPDPAHCQRGHDKEECTRCWDREIPETENPRILDSGTRREFATGAVRDIQEGKGRCDLMPLDVIFAILDDDYIFHYLHCFQNDGNVCHLFVVLHHFCDSAYDHLTSTMFLEVAKHFEAGAQKYGEWNWQKGIPTHCYVDSAVRHYLKYLRGDNDEPHDRAFVWNIICCIWTCQNKPELNDYAKEKEHD